MGSEQDDSYDRVVNGSAKDDGYSNRPKESKMIIAMAMLIGTGVLLPWNAFLTAFDFFVDIYKDFPFEFLIGCFYNAAGSTVLFLCIFLGEHLGPLGRRLAICFLLDFIMLAVVPVLAVFVDPAISVWLVLSCVAVTGAVSAVSFGAAMNLSSLFGPKSIAAAMTGNGISGLVVSIIRIITKITVPHSWKGDVISASSYFVTAAIIVLICIFASIYLVRTPEAIALIRQNAQNAKQEEEEKASLLNLDRLSSNRPKQSPTVGSVFKKVWLQAFTVWLVFFVTLSLFPGVVTMVKPYPDNDSYVSLSSDSDSSFISSSSVEDFLTQWFSLILITLFMIFDFLGRFLPSVFVIGSAGTLWIPVAIRLVFFPLFALLAAGIWTSYVYIWAPIVDIIFAFTNGYFSTVAMIFGPAKADPDEVDIASTIMSFSLNFGILCGSFFSLLMLYLINGSLSI